MIDEIILTGGLGNQLFGVLEACRLLLKNRRRIILNIAEFQPASETTRPLLVDILLPELSNYFIVDGGIFAKFRCLLSRISRKIFGARRVSGRIPGDEVAICSLIPWIKTHRAYFQYFDDTPLDMAAVILLISLMTNKIVQKENHTLAMHVRRGDYLIPQHSIHGTISVHDLIVEANIAIMKGSFDKVIIFSDSPEQIDLADFSTLGVPCVLDEGGDAIGVFLRMAECSGIIASNSTFSLWAALLGRPRYVALPEFWMTGTSSRSLGFPNMRRFPCTR